VARLINIGVVQNSRPDYKPMLNRPIGHAKIGRAVAYKLNG